MTDQARTDDDSQVLYPDASITIDGREVEVREFRYEDGLRAAAIGRPILAALKNLIDETDSDEIDPVALDAAIGASPGDWIALIALSTGEDAEWIKRLPDSEGTKLSIAFWETNAPFFMRRLVLAAAVSDRQRGSRSPSRRSSPSSSPPDTVATT